MSKPFDLKRGAILLFIILLALVFASEFGPGRRGKTAQEVSNEVVAHIGNKKIMLDDVLKETSARVGQDITPLLRDPAFASGDYRKNLEALVERSLEQLVELALLEQQAPNEGIAISNSELLAHLQKNPAFHKDGQFDSNTYQRLVQSNTGLTTVAFEKEQRTHIARLKLQQFLSRLSYISDEELYAEYALMANKANVRFVRFSPAQLAAQMTTPPTPRELEKFVGENSKAIEEAYQQNSQDYVEPERLHLRQIFIERSADTLESSEITKKKAEKLAEALQQGADFASLARESSDDAETKTNGGDMGWKDALGLPPLLATTVFNMKTGEISPPLETPRGYLIYKVEERSESQTKPLQTVQP
ncbi:MAG: SurA N-terminal domain-containing protein, partial [Proteobacteria bacterium]|nr:SurA N-terminal domain-containing protein [Pseudomonadota bacterium]